MTAQVKFWAPSGSRYKGRFVRNTSGGKESNHHDALVVQLAVPYRTSSAYRGLFSKDPRVSRSSRPRFRPDCRLSEDRTGRLQETPRLSATGYDTSAVNGGIDIGLTIGELEVRVRRPRYGGRK